MENEIVIIKSYLRNYTRYKSLIDEKKGNLELIDKRLEDLNYPKSVSYDSIPSSSTKSLDSRIIELVSNRWEAEEDIKYYSSIISKCDRIMNSLEDGDRWLLNEWYIIRKCKNWDTFCQSNNYSSSGMTKKLNAILKRAICHLSICDKV